MVITLPFSGLGSLKLKRQMYRLVGAVVPGVDLRVVFKPMKKLSVLCKLKSHVPILSRSNVVYKVHCNECNQFYVGKTKRILKQRLLEHKNDDNSALLRHSRDTGHCIVYDDPAVIATDSDDLRLYVKESFKIKELSAYKYLNGNIGSLELNLW